MAGTSKRGLSASKSRSSGMKGGTRRRANGKSIASRGRPGPSIAGEKRVPATARTVGVKAPVDSLDGRLPDDPRAIDRRRQVVGGDDEGARSGGRKSRRS